ncbi:MAG: MBOAT family O-acyltransferase [Bacteroidales bacterium]|nr:MBOAT family protein [Bacteroidales bacterium]MDD4830223.1 MBOAT family protein [Bacteroidales bacterium]
MVFSSTLFLLYFLPVFLLIYHIVPKSWKNYVILVSSIIFYAWGAPKFLFVIILSIIFTFYLVRTINNSSNIKKRRILLFVGILINIGLLAYFKYANFFVENVNFLISKMGYEPAKWIEVALPIGISFFTFQTITYILDVYRKVHSPLDKLTDYMLYIMAFPQMIAGPIVRFNTIADQIIKRDEVIDDKLSGFYRFSIGLAKKVLIANVMAAQADAIFNGNVFELSTPNAWLGIIAYTFQIYFDFSGYSDMAIGLGKMMGFTFPENFDMPYTSKSISEFWRRWHMTLGNFMKDYLYIPLGGNKVSKRRMYFNLWVVFLISGLWHGASWNFVIWGAYHGLFLVLDKMFLIKFLNRIGGFFSTVFTFFVVMIGWVLFRSETLDFAITYIGKLFSFTSFQDFYPLPAFTIMLLISVIFAFFPDFKYGNKIKDFFFNKETYNIKQNICLSLMAIILLFLSISFVVSSDFNPFIYYRF